MLDAIKTLIRCTATNDTVPILTSIAIIDDHMHAFNGRMYGRMPITSNPFELNNICIRANMLHAALSALGDTKAKTEIDAEHGTLRFSSRRYRARIPVLPIEDFYKKELPMQKKANKIEFDLAGAFASLKGIVGNNAMLAWTHGYLLSDNHMAATNARTMARLPAPCSVSDAIVTTEFADEVIAQSTPVTHLSFEKGQITAWFGNGLVLSSVVMEGTWPKSFGSIINPLMNGAKFTPIPEGALDALELIVPFSNDASSANVTLDNDKLELVSSETASASVTIDGIKTKAPCSFNATQLRTVLGMAAEWDLSKFPMVPFRNKEHKLEGGFAGVRV